jgi:hypothetical protein
VQFPVDDATLAAWSNLLTLTDAQKAEVLAEVEECLRLGYERIPHDIRPRAFEDLVIDIPADEFALMFLTAGLRITGHPAEAQAVLRRALTNSD